MPQPDEITVLGALVDAVDEINREDGSCLRVTRVDVHPKDT